MPPPRNLLLRSVLWYIAPQRHSLPSIESPRLPTVDSMNAVPAWKPSSRFPTRPLPPFSHYPSSYSAQTPQCVCMYEMPTAKEEKTLPNPSSLCVVWNEARPMQNPPIPKEQQERRRRQPQSTIMPQQQPPAPVTPPTQNSACHPSSPHPRRRRPHCSPPRS